MSFEGKVVMITGSRSGIEVITAKKFRDEGANVVVVVINKEKLDEVRKPCEQFGERTVKLELDICNEDDTKNQMEIIFKHFGKIDVLVNNVDIGGDIDIMSEKFMDDYDRIINVNLRAAVYLMHMVIPHLLKSKGSIINVTSTGENVNIGVGGAMPYCISKAGLDQFFRCIATQLAQHGVRVNTVNPGPVKTDPLINSSMSNDPGETTLLNRMSEPEEIADMILYLASDKAKSITGSHFIIDNA